MEQVGNQPDAVGLSECTGVSSFQDTQVFGYDQGNSHYSKIVWQLVVDWYVEARWWASHGSRTHALQPVSSRAGARQSSGEARPKRTTRYIYVSSFKRHAIADRPRGFRRHGTRIVSALPATEVACYCQSVLLTLGYGTTVVVVIAGSG